MVISIAGRTVPGLILPRFKHRMNLLFAKRKGDWCLQFRNIKNSMHPSQRGASQTDLSHRSEWDQSHLNCPRSHHTSKKTTSTAKQHQWTQNNRKMRPHSLMLLMGTNTQQRALVCRWFGPTSSYSLSRQETSCIPQLNVQIYSQWSAACCLKCTNIIYVYIQT